MAIPITELSPSEAAESLAARGGSEWTRQLVDELDRTIRTDPLDRFVTLWALSNAAAARVFGVSRQAFTKWRKAGPPAIRAAAVADLASTTDLLDRYVKRERIPAVVRRPADRFGGRSLLDVAEQGDTHAVLEHVAAMLDLRRIQP
jgi:hypothetical protein